MNYSSSLFFLGLFLGLFPSVFLGGCTQPTPLSSSSLKDLVVVDAEDGQTTDQRLTTDQTLSPQRDLDQEDLGVNDALVEDQSSQSLVDMNQPFTEDLFVPDLEMQSRIEDASIDLFIDSFTLDASLPLSICGNGQVEGSEECDDGNTNTESCL